MLKVFSISQMTSTVFAVLFQLFISPSLIAQQLSAGTPESVGMSTERLKRIDNSLSSYIETQQIPGAIALIVRNGKVVYHKAFGYDDIDEKIPFKKDAIVRIASQTKAITSAAVMMLYEEGHFLLDDPVSKYLPTYANPQVIETFNEKDTTYTTRPAKREITIRDLLTHNSGIGYAVIGSKHATALYAKHNIILGLENPSASLGETMERLGKLPLFHDPGEKHLYGLNTDILGYLVEKISGKTLAEFMEERIFKPLNMKDTHFSLPESKHNRLAKLYTETQDKKTIKAAGNSTPIAPDGSLLEDFPRKKGTYYSGGGGLSSTALDYAAFLQMLLNGGIYNNQQLLSPTTVRLFTTNQLGGLSEGKTNFSLGFGITTAQQAARFPISEGTFDWGGAFGTQYWADPVEGIIGVLLTQKLPSSWGGEFANKFKAGVYQAITKSNRKLGD